MPRLQILNSIEKQALEQIAATSSDEVSKRAKILLGLNEGKKYVALAQEIGVTEKSIAKWKKRWTSCTILPESQESAIAKANEVLGVNVGRPKKCKSTEANKIVEISEWSKNRKPCRSKHHYHMQVAEEATRRGLPTLSPRSIGRILEAQT
ncbi:helix-turn-helix domain-containing protein [Nostoc sphaeroides]|uniref:Helix-turn-helix domain-containing protein n=1 Tax=Nostoc sphaeroides CCNUC1 TaxID=2653204 RepID=A0A5P8WC04_9NOSO|nr:helix-turn-helix domain-containing protein [Nostoc sphaeroides]MCC5632364.1 helix-turn-helix domain-containing protein [Nostoc sphaeroides CHAB 2801]QFS50355.1 helix-turn-helix domain-containing protein [Nostoc sphaeroides CCNUC1]